MIETMMEDKRTVRSIHGNEWDITVGISNITKIVPYLEPGEIGEVTWFALYQGAFLWGRVDSVGLLVRYVEPTNA